MRSLRIAKCLDFPSVAKMIAAVSAAIVSSVPDMIVSRVFSASAFELYALLPSLFDFSDIAGYHFIARHHNYRTLFYQLKQYHYLSK